MAKKDKNVVTEKGTVFDMTWYVVKIIVAAAALLCTVKWW